MALVLTPEQEAVVEQSVREGRFASVDDALSAAVNAIAHHGPASKEEEARLEEIRSKTLFQLMQESPLYGGDIEFERDRSPMRDIGF